MYLISYDISRDKIRNKIAKLLEGYGKRVQYSVFECEISSERFSGLYAQLVELVNKDPEGNVRCYQLCSSCTGKIVIIGTTEPDPVQTEEGLFIV